MDVRGKNSPESHIWMLIKLIQLDITLESGDTEELRTLHFRWKVKTTEPEEKAAEGSSDSVCDISIAA